MYVYADEQVEIFRQHFKELKEKNSRMILAEGDIDAVHFYLKLENVINEDYKQIFLHNMNDVDEKHIFTNGFLHHERYIGEENGERREVAVDCVNLYGHIKFGMMETSQSEVQLFKKRRTCLITDTTDPKEFDPLKSYIFRRTIIVSDIDTSGERTTDVSHQLHIYKPNVNALVKFVTND